MNVPGSQSKPAIKKKGFPWAACLIVGSAVVLGVGIMAVVVMLFMVNRQPPETLEATIHFPQNGESVEANEQLDVSVSGRGSAGVSRLEVYADGGLILARDNEEEGINLFTLNDLWAPAASGRHVLMARVYGPTNQFADSAVAYVDVADASPLVEFNLDEIQRLQPETSRPSLNDIAAGTGASVEELYRYNPNLDVTNPSEPLPAGSRVQAPRPAALPPDTPSVNSPIAPSIPPAPLPGTPNAPATLSATASCETASLSWEDSPDEQGYKVYRLDPGHPYPQVVATLRPNATSYQDTLPQGSGGALFRYQVAAVRDGLEGSTGMVSTSPPDNCPTIWAAGTAADLVLTNVTFTTESAWDGVYCYLSTNGQPFERYPVGDFTIIPPAGSSPKAYSSSQTSTARSIVLDGQPVVQPVTLRGECMGRKGAQSTSLGTIESSHDQSQWTGGAHDVLADGFQLRYCLGPGSNPCGSGSPGPGGVVRPTLEPAGTDRPNTNIPAPTNFRLPNNFGYCTQPSMVYSDWLECLVSYYRDMTMPSGSVVRGVPVAWDWNGSASVSENTLTGYFMIWNDRDLNGPATNTVNTFFIRRRNPASPIERYQVTPLANVPCGHQVDMKVAAVTSFGQSEFSNTIQYQTPACINYDQAARVQISFETLEILEPVIDYGEECWALPFPPFYVCPAGPSDNLEAYGFIGAGGGTLRWTERTLEPVRDFRQDTYNLADWAMAPRGGPYVYRTGQNTFETYITRPDEPLRFDFFMYDADHDTWNLDNRARFCVVEGNIPPQSVDRWKTYNHTFQLEDRSAHQDYAPCTVTVRVTGGPGR